LEGCIPSKVLINVVELGNSVKAAESMGLSVDGLKYDIDKLRFWTNTVIKRLTGNVRDLLEKRKIRRITGRATFLNNNQLTINDGEQIVNFKNCIVATGSRINRLPSGYDLPLWSSAEALKLPEIPERLVVIGGGYIGLEMGLVYSGLGSKVTVVEFSKHLLMSADADLVDVMVGRCERNLDCIKYESRVKDVKKNGSGYIVVIDNKGQLEEIESDQVLVAIGRCPNTDNIGLENTEIKIGDRGLIEVNKECRTSVPHIFAIGDIVPGHALAHKASREAKVAAEVIANHMVEFDNHAIPAVVFTDPEIAWCGLTELEAKKDGIKYNVGKFPLRGLGRAQAIGRTDGMVKILSDPETNQVIGVGMVGPHVSELIAEATLAIQTKVTLEDLMVTIHPHPTISEAILEAVEITAGVPIHK
ncbi:MAG: dihydrolipoyl dehydrogenase, partial [Calditrichaeota bacterium]|nr:dihydrolipoyl dehydrogenase [Calditrichota bacterium]